MKPIKAWAALQSPKKIMFIGGCWNTANPINHLEIFPTRKAAREAFKDDSPNIEIIPVLISPTK